MRHYSWSSTKSSQSSRAPFLQLLWITVSTVFTLTATAGGNCDDLIAFERGQPSSVAPTKKETISFSSSDFVALLNKIRSFDKQAKEIREQESTKFKSDVVKAFLSVDIKADAKKNAETIYKKIFSSLSPEQKSVNLNFIRSHLEQLRTSNREGIKFYILDEKRMAYLIGPFEPQIRRNIQAQLPDLRAAEAELQKKLGLPSYMVNRLVTQVRAGLKFDNIRISSGNGPKIVEFLNEGYLTAYYKKAIMGENLNTLAEDSCRLKTTATVVAEREKIYPDPTVLLTSSVCTENSRLNQIMSKIDYNDPYDTVLRCEEQGGVWKLINCLCMPSKKEINYETQSCLPQRVAPKVSARNQLEQFYKQHGVDMGELYDPMKRDLTLMGAFCNHPYIGKTQTIDSSTTSPAAQSTTK